MSWQGCMAAAGVECTKLRAQITPRLVLAACIVGPVAFAAAIRLQSNLPEDTLFGRSAKESGVAVALVVLGFAGLWVLPVVASVVGGDVFAAEDRYGTWKMVLTRSRSRAEIFVGKVLTSLAFTSLAVIVLAAASITAGVLAIGDQPLINLSGVLVPTPQASLRAALAWMSTLPPALAMTSVAILIAVITRSSAAGIGLPVVVALLMQLYAYIDGPQYFRLILVTSAFSAWHGLLSEPPYYGPLVDGIACSAGYVVLSLGVAYRLQSRRNIGG